MPDKSRTEKPSRPEQIVSEDRTGKIIFAIVATSVFCWWLWCVIEAGGRAIDSWRHAEELERNFQRS